MVTFIASPAMLESSERLDTEVLNFEKEKVEIMRKTGNLFFLLVRCWLRRVDGC